jgi:hypothetical protein
VASALNKVALAATEAESAVLASEAKSANEAVTVSANPFALVATEAVSAVIANEAVIPFHQPLRLRPL